MNQNQTKIPWNARIQKTVKKLIDQVGELTRIPLQVYHIPSDENLLNEQAQTQDTATLKAETREIRIASIPVLLIKGFFSNGHEETSLKTALTLVQNVLTDYLQSQAEIESFSKEILETYQTINMLYKISEVLGNIQDVKHVASILLNQAVAITQAERGSVFLREDDSKVLQIEASYGFSTLEMQELQSLTLNLSDNLCSHMLQSDKPLIIEDIQDHPNFEVYSKGIYKTGSFLSIPLYAGGDDQEKPLLGVLNLADKTISDSFKSNDLKLLTALTAQGSIAIANAQTLKELRHSKVELKKTLQELMTTYENLEKRAVIIEQINKISLAINATLDLDRLFDKICSYAKSMANAEEAAVYYNKDTSADPGEASYEFAWTGCSDAQIWQNTISLPEIIERGEIFSLEQPEPSVILPHDDGGLIEVRNLIAIPFFVKGRSVGVIAVANKISAENFSQDDKELLKTLGNQTAVAVENAKLVADQKALLLETIMALAAAVDAKDPYTHNHSKNVSIYSKAISEQMSLSEKELETLELAAILHDIGKIAVPESILNKPDKLTLEEFEIMKTHPVSGVKIVEGIKEMEEIFQSMKYHHERHDGKGYPDNLKGDEIPFLARIIAVADTYDAITSDRPYRKGPGHEFALNEIKKCSGTQFAPDVVEAFLKSTICKNRAEELAIKA